MIRIPADLPSHQRIAGRLVFIDASNRLIRVWDGDVDREVLVPPGCEVRLNNEPIRLRLLEEGDPVEVEVIQADAELQAVTVRSDRIGRW